MSKSLGNVVSPLEMAEKYGVNAFRYFLLREMVFGNDSSFSEKALVGRLNADLANDLGNLFSRTLSMTHKYFEGKVPAQGDEADEDCEIKSLGRKAMAEFQNNFMDAKFSRGLEGLWELVRGLNKYIDTTQPWTLYKEENMSRLGTVMYVLLENMRKIAVHLWPVMPEASEMMLEQLGIKFAPEKVNLQGEIDVWGLLDPGSEVAKKSNLFPRVELPKEEPAPKKKKQESQEAVQTG